MFYRRNKVITLCHGSDHEIRKPFYGGGEVSNDYGSGFYCVSEKNKELAKEWSCSIYGNSYDGIVNTYEFNTEGMSILNLDKFDFNKIEKELLMMRLTYGYTQNEIAKYLNISQSTVSRLLKSIKIKINDCNN